MLPPVDRADALFAGMLDDELQGALSCLLSHMTLRGLSPKRGVGLSPALRERLVHALLDGRTMPDDVLSASADAMAKTMARRGLEPSSRLRRWAGGRLFSARTLSGKRVSGSFHSLGEDFVVVLSKGATECYLCRVDASSHMKLRHPDGYVLMRGLRRVSVHRTFGEAVEAASNETTGAPNDTG